MSNKKGLLSWWRIHSPTLSWWEPLMLPWRRGLRFIERRGGMLYRLPFYGLAGAALVDWLVINNFPFTVSLPLTDLYICGLLAGPAVFLLAVFMTSSIPRYISIYPRRDAKTGARFVIVEGQTPTLIPLEDITGWSLRRLGRGDGQKVLIFCYRDASGKRRLETIGVSSGIDSGLFQGSSPHKTPILS